MSLLAAQSGEDQRIAEFAVCGALIAADTGFKLEAGAFRQGDAALIAGIAADFEPFGLYIDMLMNLPDKLGAYSDLETLTQIADNAASTWDVFGIDSVPD